MPLGDDPFMCALSPPQLNLCFAHYSCIQLPLAVVQTAHVTGRGIPHETEIELLQQKVKPNWQLFYGTLYKGDSSIWNKISPF